MARGTMDSMSNVDKRPSQQLDAEAPPPSAGPRVRGRLAIMLVLVLVSLAAGTLVIRASQHTARVVVPRAPPTARAGSPVLVQEDLVTGSASSVPSANGWGAQGDRLVRASNGDLYTVYLADGSDSDHFRWVLAKERAGTTSWQTAAEGVTASEPGNPPQVLLAPSGTVYVVTISSWDSPGAGAPQIWDSASDTTRVIPGHWLTGDEMRRAGPLYPSAGIDAKGNIYVWEDVPCASFTYADGRAVKCRSANSPGTYYWAFLSAADGRWHAEQWQSDYRQAYNFLLAQSTSDLVVIGTRDIRQAPAEAPYACPGSGGYCFDQVRAAKWTDLSRPAASLTVVRTAQDAPGYGGGLRASAEDAYVDTDGRAHVLASVVDASTKGSYESHHLIIDASGAVKDVEYAGVPYPNLSRILQDRSGRFWIYSVGPDLATGHGCNAFIAGGMPGDTDGTELGKVTVIPFSGSYDCSTEERNFDASPRSGTARTNFIDGVVETNGGRDWVHYRIALPSLTGRTS